MDARALIRRRFGAGLLVLVVVSMHAGVCAATLSLPYCESAPAGDAWMQVSVHEQAADGLAANALDFRFCWTESALHAEGEIVDHDLLGAPAELAADRFHAFDSMQIYLDPRADSGPVMNRDDVDLLFLPDGRYAVLRGDELWQRVDSARVPQRESAPLLLDYAASTRNNAWRVRIAIPFAGLGIQPRSGQQLRMDVAMSDWRIDAAQPPAGTAVDAFQLRALAWSGSRDFGYPRDWRLLTLVGEAPWWQRALNRFGVARLWLASVLAGAVLTFLLLWLQAVRHQAQLRRLLARIEHPKGADLPRFDARVSAEPALADPAPQVQAESPSDPALVTPDARDTAFAADVLAHVRTHLRSPHSPQSLAAHFHVSLRTLQRRLKAGLDSTPQDLILAARLDHAHRLLKAGSLRVSEVADAVGFDDASHFTRRFKEAYGCTPSQVRDSG